MKQNTIGRYRKEALKNFTYPMTIYYTIFHGDKNFLDGIKSDEGYEYIFNSLKDREKFIILLLYKEGLTLEKTGEIIGVCKERVRSIDAKLIRKFRHPKNVRIIRNPQVLNEIRSDYK